MISDNAGEEEKAVAAAVLSAIIVLAGLLVYMSLTPAAKVPFVSLYYLNSEKMAKNYPQSLVLNKNNTFLLWIGVKNFMGRIEHFSILVKVDNGTGRVTPSPLDPVYRFEKVLADRETWEFPITITLNQTLLLNKLYTYTCRKLPQSMILA